MTGKLYKNNFYVKILKVKIIVFLYCMLYSQTSTTVIRWLHKEKYININFVSNFLFTQPPTNALFACL